VKKLERITTEYIEAEDRIRLCGKVASGVPVVIWLTQRLLQRLLPALLRVLEGNSADVHHAEALQGFAQQVARAELKPQVPVQAGAGSAAWVALSVDIATSAQAVSLTFRDADGQAAMLMLEATPLRQWLGILRDLYVKAEWPCDVWPGWTREGALPATGLSAVLH
jgi:hypothetical protein